jgi:hypothetical protein
MADLVLHILQPANGAKLAGTGNVRLQAQLGAGSAAGLFFKWYSTLNAAATQDHPELNAADHSAAKLDWTTPLDVGTHVITLAAADRDGNDLASIKAVTRSAFAGGAPASPEPCVIHRLQATLKTPATDGASLSKASATLEALAPSRWGKKHPTLPGAYVMDPDYHAVNGLRYRFRFAPAGPPDASKTAEVIPAASALTFFIGSDDKPYVRWSGALPGNLGTGAYVLTLYVESLDGSVGHNVSRNVTLTA